jgi:osmotically-inducible protein OsmY
MRTGTEARARRRAGAARGVAAVLALACAGCPAMAITMGARTAAEVVTDDRSTAQQGDDLALKGRIAQALLAESGLGVAQVHVDVFRGQVMLTGVVPDGRARQVAADTARSVAGPGRVFDDLLVGPPSLIDDAADVARNERLGLRLLADEGLASQSLLHRVVAGTAYVMGQVGSPAQIDAVRAVARETPGIDGVVTHLTVGP